MIEDLSKITLGDFEYLSRALLRELGFQNLLWRKGGRDRGRDIVAEFARPEPDGRIILEKWFVECKHHSRSNPVSVQHLQTKIAWAEAEGADYLLVITSSYLTPDAKDWLEKLGKNKSFKIRYWEDSHLMDLLNRYPKLYRIYIDRRTVEKCRRNQSAGAMVSRRIQSLQEALSVDNSIELEEILGNPPDRLVLTIHCRAISDFDSHDKPIFRDTHRIIMSFAMDFPFSLPQIIVVTPIVHPHVYEHGTVCYGYRDPLSPIHDFLKQLQMMLSSYLEEGSGHSSFVNRDPRLLKFIEMNSF